MSEINEWKPHRPFGASEATNEFYDSMGVTQRMEPHELGSRWRFKIDDIECSPQELHIHLEAKMRKLGVYPNENKTS